MESKIYKKPWCDNSFKKPQLSNVLLCTVAMGLLKGRCVDNRVCTESN